MHRLLILFVILILPACAHGHGGGQDSNGGHVDRSTGEYHCHKPDCVLPPGTDPEEDVNIPPDGEDHPDITIAGSWRTGVAQAIKQESCEKLRQSVYYRPDVFQKPLADLESIGFIRVEQHTRTFVNLIYPAALRLPAEPHRVVVVARFPGMSVCI